MQLLFDNRDEHVGGYGTLDLRRHGVLAVAQKSLDAQMLLDPFEEQFHLPTILVKLGNDRRWQRRVVGQKDQRLSRRWVFESHTAQMLWVVTTDVMAIERHRLIADHAGGLVHLGRVHTPGVEIGFGTSDKEGSGLVHRVQACKIQLAPVHDVERARFKWQDVEHIDIAHLCITDVNETGDAATQVQQRVQLDRRLRRTKWRPIKQAQAQVDGGRIQSIDIAGDLHIHAQWLVGIELVGASNQDCREVRPDAPVTPLVGIGKRGAAHRLTQTHRVELGGVGTQGGLDVAQGFAPSQLRVGHDAEVFGAGQRGDSRIAGVTCNDASEAGPRHKLHQLSEKHLANIHEESPKKSIWGNYSQKWLRNSNRHQIKRAANPRGYWHLAKNVLCSPDSSGLG